MSITKLGFDIRRKIAGLHESVCLDVRVMSTVGFQHQEGYADCHPYITRLLYKILLRRGKFHRVVLMIVIRCPRLDKAETT